MTNLVSILTEYTTDEVPYISSPQSTVTPCLQISRQLFGPLLDVIAPTITEHEVQHYRGPIRHVQIGEIGNK